MTSRIIRIITVVIGVFMSSSSSYAMTDQKFWSLIETSREVIKSASVAQSEDDVNRMQMLQINALDKALSDLQEAEFIEFYKIYSKYLGKAYHWDLWAAAYIINGGCSDDCFHYFRSWLIAQGEATYHNALKNPEILIGIATPEYTEFELFEYVVIKAFSKKFSKEMPRPDVKHFHPKKVQGEEWEEETLNTKYPKLYKWAEDALAAER